jgi:hypothetical protein
LLVAVEGFGERLRSAAATTTRESAGLIASLPKIENVLAISLLEVVRDGLERPFPILAPTVRDLNDPASWAFATAIFERKPLAYRDWTLRVLLDRQS